MLKKLFLVMMCTTLAACDGGPAGQSATAQTSEPTLTETYWKLVELRGTEVKPTHKEAHIILKNEDNKVIGSGGCNFMGGGYALSGGNRIRFTNMMSTMMACAEGMDREGEFAQTLEQVDSYVIKDGRLQLLRARMAPLAVFEPVYLQ